MYFPGDESQENENRIAEKRAGSYSARPAQAGRPAPRNALKRYGK